MSALRDSASWLIGTYTANNDPDEISIDPHNEMSYNNVYPSKVSYVKIQSSFKLIPLTNVSSFHMSIAGNYENNTKA